MRRDMQEPLSFFQSCYATFSRLIAVTPVAARIDAVLDDAYRFFDARVAAAGAHEPTLACRKACATCCSLRVTATAPEVLRIARHMRLGAGSGDGLRRIGRIAAADARTRGLDEKARVGLRERCAFIEASACTIYPLRPLACRGHASFDRRACVDAACGKTDAVPHSNAHRDARSLIQNAMQSALRDTGCAWAAYELNHALRLALADPDCEAAWLDGVDVFADAQVSEVSVAEMAATFDQLKHMLDSD